jgi:glycerol dehydrogenase-like iron-containing ADH family enzyme
MSEMIKELRTAKVACQKISCPFESVPSQCSADGFISLGTTFHNVGSYGEKKDRKAMTRMITSTPKLKVKR